MSAESATPARRASFRPDVQGIRAVAVLLVVANHLAPGSLSGGFVGVDVFFVVSGFLITHLLLREAARDGRVSLAGFYARRARRILPAATLVTVVTVVGSLLTLAALRTQTVVVDALWATLFAGNARFALVGTDYFAQGQPPSPLRHYWSLAVEEQFYLVWPLLFLGCVLLARRRRGRSDAGAGGREQTLRRTLLVVLLVVVVLSLAWSWWATQSSPTTAYYSTFARAHELAVGALVAVAAPWLRLPGALRQALAIAGLVGIGAAAWLFTAGTAFPGVAALLPVLATAALLVAGGSGGEPSTAGARLLSLPPLVRLGDWSYSIYLWHWPVIVLVRSNLGPERFATFEVRAAVLALVLVLSWASFRWVETPFRVAGTFKRTGRAMLIYPVSVVAVVAVVLASNATLSYRLGEFSDEPAVSLGDYEDSVLAQDRYEALVQASVLAAEEGRAVPGDLTPGLLGLRSQTASLGECDYRTGTRQLCAIGDPDAERSIVVLGDSHARALSPAVEEIGRRHGYRVYVLVYSGCSASALQQVRQDTGDAWGECEEFKAWARSTIADMQPDLVVVSTSSGRFRNPDTGKQMGGFRRFPAYLRLIESGWEELFEDLASDARQVAVVGNTPKLPRETGVCLSQGDPDLGDCLFEPGPYAQREAAASFRAARAAGIDAVDAQRWFCADDLCPSVVGSYITMRDSEHMTPDYSRWLATPLARELGLEGPDGA